VPVVKVIVPGLEGVTGHRGQYVRGKRARRKPTREIL
jgi:hypothetical protein